MTDYLIIGQGIAGSLLAWELLKHKKSIVIVDNHHKSSSSVISAGIINSISGKRFTVIDKFGDLFSSAMTTYEELGELFEQNFFESKSTLRIFQSEEEYGFWVKRLKQNVIQNYCEKNFSANYFNINLKDKLGSVVIIKSGFCHSAKLLDSLRQYFEKQNILYSGEFFYDELKIFDNYVLYKGDKYKKVIFCEGYKAQLNPWFQWIPFQNVKGEILKVKIDDQNLPKMIINKGKWIVPLKESQWMAGATYEWNQLDCQPTEVGKNEILNGLSEYIKGDINIIDHKAGVRPATTDQSPVLGLHPSILSLGIFNGFGSKGFLMAPYYAKMLADNLCEGAIINKTVLIERFCYKIN